MPPATNLISPTDFDKVVALIAEKAAANTSRDGRLLIAVAGVPGSGKTTLAAQFVDAVSATAGVPCVNMPMDGYHTYRKDLDEMPNPKEAHERRGCEWTFDSKKLLADLNTMKGSSATFKGPSFDHAVKDPVEEDVVVDEKHRVVVMEGNYLAYTATEDWKAVRECFDLVVFLRCPLEVSTKRLAQRHIEAWGISMEAAMARAGGSDFLNAQLSAGTEGNADIVVDSISW